jgi:hypothetical protein
LRPHLSVVQRHDQASIRTARHSSDTGGNTARLGRVGASAGRWRCRHRGRRRRRHRSCAHSSRRRRRGCPRGSRGCSRRARSSGTGTGWTRGLAKSRVVASQTLGVVVKIGTARCLLCVDVWGNGQNRGHPEESTR